MSVHEWTCILDANNLLEQNYGGTGAPNTSHSTVLHYHCSIKEVLIRALHCLRGELQLQ